MRFAALPLLFLIAHGLHAKPVDEFLSFRSGRIYADLSGGAPRIGEGISVVKDDPLTLRNLRIAQEATNPRAQALGRYSAWMRPDSRVLARNLRMGFEYAVSDYVGLGYSIEHTDITVKNVPLTQSFNLMPWLLMMTAGMTINPSASPQPVDYLNAMVHKVHIGNLGTVNGDLAFHAGNIRRVDPYLRLTLGVGPEGSYMTRFSGTIGLRLFLIEHVYFLIEGYQSKLHIVYPANGLGSSSGSSSSESSSSSSSSFAPAFTSNPFPSAHPGGVQGDFTAQITGLTEQGWRAGLGMCY